MSDRFYRLVHFVGSKIFWVSSRAVVLHLDRVPRSGAFILAANHHSPFDVPLMIRHTPAIVDFVSIYELFENRFVKWFYGSMGAFPIERRKPDAAGVRTILDRLGSGRRVAMFPEAGVRRPPNSVTHGGPIRSGLGRLALMSGAPVVPCAVVNAEVYSRLTAWLPLKRVRYAIVYGEPIMARTDVEEGEAAREVEEEFKRRVMSCYAEGEEALFGSAGGMQRSTSNVEHSTLK